jgi:acetolactate synthase I/II/III large subunit
MNDPLFTEPNVARYLLRAIRDEGVAHAFLVTGYKIAPFLSQFDEAKVTPIVACHEGGAVYMADGYARATKNFGLAMGIGGPGVTNMVTAVAAAYSDRSPVLILAGYIPFTLEGQGAFQDSSSTAIEDRDLMRPMTAFAEVIPSKELAGSFVHKAVKASGANARMWGGTSGDELVPGGLPQKCVSQSNCAGPAAPSRPTSIAILPTE